MRPRYTHSLATAAVASATLAACSDRSATAPTLAPVIVSASPQVAPGKPVREPVADSFYEFASPAGEACSFPVTGKAVVNRFETKTFPAEANGDVVQLSNGHLVFRFTNVASGKYVDLNISGPGKATFHADGSMTQDATGVWYWLFPKSANVPGGLTLFLSKGRLVVETSPTGERSIVGPVGKLEDLCPMLQ